VEIAFRSLAEPVTELRVIEHKLCARLFAAAVIERLARKIYGSGRVTGYSVVIDCVSTIVCLTNGRRYSGEA
jgi:hypothetical protein